MQAMLHCLPDGLLALDPAGEVTFATGKIEPLLGVPVSAVLSEPVEAWCEDVAGGQTIYGAIVGGAAVSVCASARQTPVADEAGVETALAFRGQGHAAPAVLAWAAAVRRAGREPLYSTSWSNRASLALARRLGLIQFASDLHIT
jgi:hypothetical protein